MTTLNMAVSADADDKHQEGIFVRDYTTLLSILSGDWLACRFLNATIPAGSVVNTAVFQAYITGFMWDDIDFTIYFNDVDSAAALGSANNSLSSLARTTETVTVTELAAGTGYYSFPDAAAVVQEVIDRGGWASGNNLTILLGGGASCNARFFPHNYNSAEFPPLLDITYTAPGASARSKIRLTKQGARAGAEAGL